MSNPPAPSTTQTPMTWRQTVIFLLATALTGAAVTVAIWLFTQAHNGINSAAFGPLAAALQPLGDWTKALIPALGGVLVALVLIFLMRRRPLPGYGHVLYSVAAEHGKLPWYRGLIYMVNATIGIGFGVPVGADVPAAMAGAYLPSWASQKLHASAELMQAVVISGVAAGIAYNYGAHVAGALFALEITYGGFGNWRIVVASVIGAGMAALGTIFIGPANPIYTIPADSTIFGGGALVVFVVVALGGGVLGVLFIKLLAMARLTLNKLPLIARAALAGLLVGIVSLFVPGILGSGVSTLQSILSGGSFTATALLVLVVGRLVLIPFAMRNGFNGGVIGPSLAMGAAYGALAAQVLIPLFPGIGLTPLQLQLIGAAAMVAAVTRGGLFAAILLTEIAGSVTSMGPILIAVGVSYLLAQYLEPRSAYTFPLQLWGIRLSRGGHVVEGSLTPAAHAAGVVPEEAGRP